MYKKFLLLQSIFIFTLSSLQGQQIHWQISNDSCFDWVHPELDKIISQEEAISLNEKEIAHIHSFETLFLRYKIEENNNGSDWSVPLPLKPFPKPPHKQLAWQKSSFVSDDSWSEVSPYLLPDNHPIRTQLDEIFQKSRIIADEKTLRKAGFDNLPKRKWDNIIVAWHSKLKGYLLKLYLDDQIGIDEKIAFKTRMEGAEYIRHSIQTFGYQSLFKVPKKWMYPLPDQHPSNPGSQRKNFILIEEDMNLASSGSNIKKWKQEITAEHLKGLYHLLQSLGLKDSVYITNIPFAKDGKISFIDTEHHHKWPVNFAKLLESLSPDMQAYWNHLILNQGYAP